MACLLQPECNFLHGYFRCRLPVRSGRCGGGDYLYAGDTYLLKKQSNTINKMYPMEHKTPSSPNNS